MKTAAQRIEDLSKIHPKGYDLSLDRIKVLLTKLGDPHHKMPPVIHVAGTNGKGSTIAFCRAILEAAGLSVHVHTSPHLVNWHERYRIGCKGTPGKLVSDAVLSDAIARVASANDGTAITVFEVLTAVMFVLFSEHDADVCLVEVGLGGRFDSTNIMDETALSIITPISIDHEAYLGDTLAKIAFEKAGIIKRKTAVISGLQQDEARDTIARQAARMATRVHFAGEDFQCQREDGRMVFAGEDCLLDLPLPRLAGDHQIENAGTAIAACLAFAGQQKWELSTGAIEKGVQGASWPGRMQRLTNGHLVDQVQSESQLWLDGGHNPGAAQMICNFLAAEQRKHKMLLTIICGMLTTKDPSGYFENLKPLNPEIICVPIVSSDAGYTPQDLSAHVASTGLRSTTANSLADAMNMVSKNPAQRIVIVGSLYLVGDALAANGTPPS